MPVFRDSNCGSIVISFADNSKIIDSKHTPGILSKSFFSLAQIVLSLNSVVPKYSLINTLIKCALLLKGIFLIRGFEGFFTNTLKSNKKNYLEYITWDYSKFTQKVFQLNSYYSISVNNHYQ